MKLKIALVIHGILGGKVIMIPETSGIRKSVFKIQDLVGALSFFPKRGVQINIVFVVISFHTPFSSNALTTLCAALNGFCVSNLRGYVLRRVRVVLLCDCLDNALGVGHLIAQEGDATHCNYSMVF